jgi:hypothetical protein
MPIDFGDIEASGSASASADASFSASLDGGVSISASIGGGIGGDLSLSLGSASLSSASSSSTTRGNLQAAKIFEVDDSGNPKGGGISVDCMFNPFEYSVSKSNTFVEDPRNNANGPQANFQQSGPQTLKLNLTFDTYEAGSDVSQITNKLWKLMMPRTNQISNSTNKVPPPMVAFEWGVFRFVAYITNMTQKFSLFLYDGTPVRAKVDITFTQYVDLNDYPSQNPTSGGGPIERVRTMIAGDRLDIIAYEVYGSAAKWRRIAEYNHIKNPLNLRAGQVISIPED